MKEKEDDISDCDARRKFIYWVN